MSKKEKIFLTLLLALIMAGVVRKFLVEAFVVRGDSMAPTIMNGDYVFINRLAYIFSEPERGHIVVALSRDPENRIIKRIIALPGERLDIHDGRVSIRSERTDPYNDIQEAYLMSSILTSGTTTIKLDSKEYFALGDNREVSLDSRNLGPVDKWDIKGKVFFVINLKELKIRKIY